MLKDELKQMVADQYLNCDEDRRVSAQSCDNNEGLKCRFSLLCEAENSGTFGLVLKAGGDMCDEYSGSNKENLIDEKVLSMLDHRLKMKCEAVASYCHDRAGGGGPGFCLPPAETSTTRAELRQNVCSAQRIAAEGASAFNHAPAPPPPSPSPLPTSACFLHNLPLLPSCFPSLSVIMIHCRRTSFRHCENLYSDRSNPFHQLSPFYSAFTPSHTPCPPTLPNSSSPPRTLATLSPSRTASSAPPLPSPSSWCSSMIRIQEENHFSAFSQLVKLQHGDFESTSPTS
eukprot:757060-Hanusia_phi.AAC.2